METTNLFKIFAEEWSRIQLEYSLGQICSERHLQLILAKGLDANPLFQASKYQLKVEPCLYGKGQNFSNWLSRLIPDMVVVINELIVAHVELKYVPNGYIPYKKDLDSFIGFVKSCANDTRIFLDVNPTTGDWSEKEFTIAENAEIIYCAIGHRDSDLFSLPIEKLKQSIPNLEKERMHFHLHFGKTGAPFPYFESHFLC